MRQGPSLSLTAAYTAVLATCVSQGPSLSLTAAYTAVLATCVSQGKHRPNTSISYLITAFLGCKHT